MLAASIPLIGFALFSLIPLILSAVISFTELHSTDLKEMEFVGFENYKTILFGGDRRANAIHKAFFPAE